MRRTSRLMTVLTLACAPLFGAEPLGDLSVYGNVWTNQAALPSGAGVFAGDVVETDEKALAVLSSSQKGRVEVRSDSRATFESEALRLERGAAASAGLPVHIANFQIRSLSNGADNWFVVADRNGERVVSAFRGDVLIEQQGKDDVVVPEGSFALAAALPTPKQAASDDDDDDKGGAAAKTRRRTGRASNSTAKSGWSLGKLGTGASVAVVTGATAAAATGLAFGLRDDSASPAN